jgi:hypothetical protein
MDLFLKNTGTLDRAFRVSIGIVLLVLGLFSEEGGTGITLIIVSTPLLFTGATGVCPTYSLLGISTKQIKTSR